MLYLSRAYESERVLKGKKETNWLEPSPLRLCRQAKRTPNSPAAFAQIGHRHLLEMLGERFARQPQPKQNCPQRQAERAQNIAPAQPPGETVTSFCRYASVHPTSHNPAMQRAGVPPINPARARSLRASGSEKEGDGWMPREDSNLNRRYQKPQSYH